MISPAVSTSTTRWLPPPRARSSTCRMRAIRRGLARVKVKGRVEPVPVPGPFTLLIDYAHNAVSMESILTTLRQYHPHRLICLFGAGRQPAPRPPL